MVACVNVSRRSTGPATSSPAFCASRRPRAASCIQLPMPPVSAPRRLAQREGFDPHLGDAAQRRIAKAAVIAFTHALRGELSGVQLALYSPPHTQTEAGEAWPLQLPKQLSPELAAAALVRSLERDPLEVLAGGNASLLWLQRLWPLAERIMRDIGLRALATLGPAHGG